MTSAQFTEYFAKAKALDVNETVVFAGGDGLVGKVEYENTYIVDLGDEKVLLENPDDESEDSERYSVYRLPGLDAVVIYANKSIPRVIQSGDYGLWTTLREFLEMVEDNKVDKVEE